MILRLTLEVLNEITEKIVGRSATVGCGAYAVGLWWQQYLWQQHLDQFFFQRYCERILI